MEQPLPSDLIVLEGMYFYGYHGSNAEERTLGQPFLVDLEAELDLAPAARSDSLDDTVSYAHLHRAAKEVMEGPPRNLLEAVAEGIAGAVLGSFPVKAVRVRVKKTRPPIRGGLLASAGVEVYRTRG